MSGAKESARRDEKPVRVRVPGHADALALLRWIDRMTGATSGIVSGS
ncbi:MAG: hypothetical protein JJU07_02665 [Natronohydrobacter sp.]|nr:hypothetical protein [Natronohydrobacter sp.]